MNFFPPLFLNEGKNSTAYYSKSTPDKLVIFVHGFLGDSIGAWNDFPILIQSKPEFINSDVLFYGYESLNGQAFDQSQEFYHFLNIYAQQTSISYRTNNFEYKTIMIVAHSLGAIVSRYALLTAINNGMSWKDKCKLFLFAPAHNGARIQNLVLMSLPSFSKVLGGIALFSKPVLDDLKPGSNCLNDLRDRTNSYQTTPERQILKASVIQAKGDKVVHNSLFCYDELLPNSPVIGKDHSSVCKPKAMIYHLPIDELANRL